MDAPGSTAVSPPAQDEGAPGSPVRPSGRLTVPPLLRGGFGFLLGEAGSKGLTFAILILIAPAMPTESFAYISLYLAFANIAAIVIGLGIQNAIVRFHFREVVFADVLGTALAIIAAMGLLVVTLGVVLRVPVGQFLGIPAEVVVLAAVGGALIAVRAAYTASLRARLKPGRHASIQVTEAAVSAALIGFLAIQGRLEYVPVILALLAATTVISILGIADWTRDPGLAIRPAVAGMLLAFSGPMVFHGLAIYILGAYGQIAVNQRLGSTDGGEFAFAYRFGMAMIVLSTAFSSAWMPSFLGAMRTPSGRSRLDRRALGYTAFMIGGAIVLMVVLPPIAWLVGGPQYRDGVRLIPIVIYSYLWYVLYTLVLGYHLDAGRTTRLAAVTVVAMGVNILATQALIGPLGLVGAALAAVIGYVALFALQAFAVHLSARQAREPIDIRYGRLVLLVIVTAVIPAAIFLAWPT